MRSAKSQQVATWDEQSMPAKSQVKKVCIILPAYNEGPVIKEVLSGLPQNSSYRKTLITLQPVVVDDGSADNTSDQAMKAKGVIVLRHVVNMGAGAATRTGLKYARRHGYDMAVAMDADGQHSAADLLEMVHKMLKQSQVDLLIGGRLSSGGNMPLHKKIGNRGLSFITFLLLGTYVSDSQSGFRAFSRNALDKLNFHSNNYAFCSEMIWQAKRAGLKIAEHPIEAIYTDYSKAKGQKSFSGALKILQQLVSRRLMELIHE